MAQRVKNLPAIQETQETGVLSLGWKDPLGEEMTTHSSILSWRIPWTEEPGLYSQSRGCKELDMTEWLTCYAVPSHSVVSDCLQPHGPHRVGCHAFLQGIFPTQGLNPDLLHCRQILYHLSHQGNPILSDFKIWIFNHNIIFFQVIALSLIFNTYIKR